MRLVPPRWRVPARYWYRRARGRIDSELTLAAAFIRPGSTVIDVGANVGIYTYGFVRLGARVEAFEPLPQCRVLLEALAAPAVRVHGVALSAAPGVLPLNLPVREGRAATGLATFRPVEEPHETLPVPVRVLDDYAFADVSFIKVDVEGHELAVLRGAERTLARERPVLLLEIDQAFLSRPAREVFDTVQAYGYDAYRADGPSLRPVRFSTDGAPIPAGGINFLFVPRGDPRAAHLVAPRA
jgi:FkbM family methyltransferase